MLHVRNHDSSFSPSHTSTSSIDPVPLSVSCAAYSPVQIASPLMTSSTPKYIPVPELEAPRDNIMKNYTCWSMRTKCPSPGREECGLVDLQSKHVRKFRHGKKTLTRSQRQKMIEKRRKDRLNLISSISHNLIHILSGEHDKYLAATKLKFKALILRWIVRVVPKASVSSGADIGRCIKILTIKCSGKTKARCVYVRAKQKFKVFNQFRRPASSATAHRINFTLAVFEQWGYITGDATYAFPNATLPPVVKFCPCAPALKKHVWDQEGTYVMVSIIRDSLTIHCS